MAAPGHFGQTLAGLLELLQDVPVNVKDILLRLRNHPRVALLGRFFVRAVRSANAVLSGSCLPASILLWLWAKGLSTARLSCVRS